MGDSSVPTALDPTILEFKGTTLERYLSNKERLIRLRSLLALSRGLRASHKEGVGTSGWGRQGHLREPPTSARPPGIPDATGCLQLQFTLPQRVTGKARAPCGSGPGVLVYQWKPAHSKAWASVYPPPQLGAGGAEW